MLSLPDAEQIWSVTQILKRVRSRKNPHRHIITSLKLSNTDIWNMSKPTDSADCLAVNSFCKPLPDGHNKDFNRMLNSHLKNLKLPHMLLRGLRVVIQRSTDTHLKLLNGRHMSLCSQIWLKCMVCVCICVCESVCEWTNIWLLMCPLGLCRLWCTVRR